MAGWIWPRQRPTTTARTRSARPESFRHRRTRSIRPSVCGNHEYVDWFRIAMELWIQQDGRVGQICTPNGTVHERSINHQVSHPVVLAAVGKVLFFRHHVAHGSRLQRRQLLLYECLDALDDLSFGLTGQYHFRSFICDRQNGACSRRIKADWASKFRVPKINGKFAIEWAHPPTLHDTHETVLTFDCGFIAMPSENKDRSVARDRVGSRAARQGNFGIAVWHQVLIHRRHAGIGCLGVLRPDLRWRRKSTNQGNH